MEAKTLFDRVTQMASHSSRAKKTEPKTGQSHYSEPGGGIHDIQ
jgi:hypothetical protein